MKPRMFIASSVDHLDLAYAAQEGLEHDVDCTVWSQGVFNLSKTTMTSLIDTLDESDFGLFVFAPSDLVQMKDASKQVVRDNVIFELGLFIGSLGQDRSFILTPRDVEDFHLPTDLTGITTASYDANRQDGNLLAALGPACNKIRRSVKMLGRVDAIEELAPTATAAVVPSDLITDENDIIALIQSWMGSRSSSNNRKAIHFAAVDAELKLAPGSTEQYIEQAAQRWNYVVERRGASTILFRDAPNANQSGVYF